MFGACLQWADLLKSLLLFIKLPQLSLDSVICVFFLLLSSLDVFSNEICGEDWVASLFEMWPIKFRFDLISGSVRERDRNRKIVKEIELGRERSWLEAVDNMKWETLNYRSKCQPYSSVLFTRFITLRSSLTFKVIWENYRQTSLSAY